MASRDGTSRESTATRAVESSLAEHLENGLIRSYGPGSAVNPWTQAPLWRVRLTNGQALDLTSPGEGVAFCRGLASASQAHRDGRYQSAQGEVPRAAQYGDLVDAAADLNLGGGPVNPVYLRGQVELICNALGMSTDDRRDQVGREIMAARAVKAAGG